MRQCIKCKAIDESNDEDHHIIPRKLGGTDMDGRHVLCKECHEDFHKRHYAVMMKLLNDSSLRLAAVKRTKDYYYWWLENG